MTFRARPQSGAGQGAAHVLIVVENLPVPLDRRVWMEAQALHEAGYRVSVICPTGPHHEQRREQISGIDIFRHALPEVSSSARGYAREYAAAMSAEIALAIRVWRMAPIDIIHVCNPPDLLFLVALPFKLLHGVRLVYDQHDLVPEMFSAKFGRRGLVYWVLRLLERVTYRVADVVITTSEAQRQVVLTRGRVPASATFLVRSGPSLETFVPRSQAGVEGRRRRFLVGYVGIMGEPEGLDLFLRGVHYLVMDKGRRDISFVLIGDGPMLKQLRALAEELSLEENVEFTGRLPTEEVIERLSTCDVCVSPDPYTAYSDTCSMNKIMEYMALGRAVVQFDLQEGRRVAGPAARYVPPNDEVAFADAILELLEDEEAAAAMGAWGRARVAEEFDWRHQKPALLQAYATLRGSGATDTHAAYAGRRT
jgi:glycosyltransferase involved in cell wall biosynthesis